MRQEQRIAELCGEIACRMQTRDQASELGIEVSGGRTELSVLVDADTAQPLAARALASTIALSSMSWAP
jgi:hypothetical protein